MQSPALSYLSPKAAVKSSPIHGRGLFAIGEFQPGEIVCVKGGHVFTRTTLAEIAPILGPAEIQIAEDLFIGPMHVDEREGGMIFSNHSCDPPRSRYRERLAEPGDSQKSDLQRRYRGMFSWYLQQKIDASFVGDARNRTLA